MFWRDHLINSEIETLLKKEDVTLQQLMEEDELLQECKSQNKKLIEYLSRPEILAELIHLTITEPASDDDICLKYKYANLASEVLTVDVPAIFDTLASSRELLYILYRFLENPLPLNPLLASFFSRVFGMLLQRRTEQVLDILKSKGDFVELTVKHIGTSAIMDLLHTIICSIEDAEIRDGVHQWLIECNLTDLLLQKLGSSDEDEQAAVAQLLCDIICEGNGEGTNLEDQSHNYNKNLFIDVLESEDTVNKLLSVLFHEVSTESSAIHTISILISLLSVEKYQLDSMRNVSNGEINVRCTVSRAIVERLPELQDMLLQPPMGVLLTAYGEEVELLGCKRLKLVTLIVALVLTNDPIVHQVIAQLNTVNHLVDLFFKFSLNNFLHTQIEQCLSEIISNNPILHPSYQEETLTSSESETSHILLQQLFLHCRIVQRIIDAHENIVTDNDKKVKHNLKGYMGHLRQLANVLVAQTEGGPNYDEIAILLKLYQINEVICLLDKEKLPDDYDKKWETFSAITLPELNRMNYFIMPVVDCRDVEMEQNCDYKASGESYPNEMGETAKEFLSSSYDWSIDSDSGLFPPKTNVDSLKIREVDGHSSSDEEDEFFPLKKDEDSMEVEQRFAVDWSDIFDRKSCSKEEKSFINPWENAPAGDLSKENCDKWAFFDSFISKSENDEFHSESKTSSEFVANFDAAFSSNNDEHDKNEDKFIASFESATKFENSVNSEDSHCNIKKEDKTVNNKLHTDLPHAKENCSPFEDVSSSETDDHKISEEKDCKMEAQVPQSDDHPQGNGLAVADE